MSTSSKSFEFETSFTNQAANEVARARIRWYSWPFYGVRIVCGFVLYALFFLSGIAIFFTALYTGPGGREALGLIIATAPVLHYWWLRRHYFRKVTKELASINPLKLSFTAEGLHITDKSGITDFAPWSTFSGYREGKTIFLLQVQERSPLRSWAIPLRYWAIPKEGVTSDEIDLVRVALRSCMPELG